VVSRKIIGQVVIMVLIGLEVVMSVSAMALPDGIFSLIKKLGGILNEKETNF
jgi:hypothetical protein